MYLMLRTAMDVFFLVKLVMAAILVCKMAAKFNIFGLTTLNKPKSRQVYTNDGIITQNIFNVAALTYVELKTNTKKLYFCEYSISTRCLLHPGYQI